MNSELASSILLYLTRGELEFQLLVIMPIAFALVYLYNKRRDGR